MVLAPKRIGRERQVHHQLLEVPAKAQWVEDRISADLPEVVIPGCDGAAQGLYCPLGA
jgi:hypothetical protein